MGTGGPERSVELANRFGAEHLQIIAEDAEALLAGIRSAGAVFLGLMIAASRLGIRGPLVYCILGVLLWVAFLKSGVHATIAGVLRR